jgi:hypothetical protein
MKHSRFSEEQIIGHCGPIAVIALTHKIKVGSRLAGNQVMLIWTIRKSHSIV